ncbi:hypothetical protein ACFHWD_04345 [Clostridium sp. MT-14]|uniref:hypothetical protein n=1 Tax=Clostridium sp. MT-14 TaxID=3348360 RepID=UPI0035F439C5
MINITKIKLFDSFAGIGALYKALKNIGIPVELTGISEIDIDAILSYNAIHNTINKSYPYYSIEQMRQYLINRNIGYDFKKKKSRIPRLKKDKIQILKSLYS